MGHMQSWSNFCEREHRYISTYNSSEGAPPIPNWCPILIKDENTVIIPEIPEVKCGSCDWGGRHGELMNSSDNGDCPKCGSSDIKKEVGFKNITG